LGEEQDNRGICSEIAGVAVVRWADGPSGEFSAIRLGLEPLQNETENGFNTRLLSVDTGSAARIIRFERERAWHKRRLCRVLPKVKFPGKRVLLGLCLEAVDWGKSLDSGPCRALFWPYNPILN